METSQAITNEQLKIDLFVGCVTRFDLEMERCEWTKEEIQSLLQDLDNQVMRTSKRWPYPKTIPAKIVWRSRRNLL